MRKIFLYALFAMIVCAPCLPAGAALPSSPVHASESPAINSDEVAVQNAMNDFKNLSKKEKKDRFKDVRDAVKKFKADKKAGSDISTNTLLLVILAILLPPLAVYLHQGETNTKFWISVVLTLLYLIPGYFFFGFLAVLYSLLVVLGAI